MARRPHPMGASLNPHDGPWVTCDRCGFISSQNRMQFQYDFMGGSVPQNLGLLVCSKCLDDLNWQAKLLILPPDPKPIFNTRPEPYIVDETSWLTTEDEEIIETESGELFITPYTNPATAANTTFLVSSISASGGSVATAYLDLFDGDPAAGGLSVLATITGSATRTNIASSLDTVLGIAQNTTPLIISTSSASQTNISYVGIYSAASGGTLLMSGTVSASPSISSGNPVRFDYLGLQIDLN